MFKSSMRLLGIDPGIAACGYGIVDYSANSIKHVVHGVITTPAHENISRRLFILYQELQDVIRKFSPDVCAVEELFFNKNVKTALLVGQARGVVLLTIGQNHLPVSHFTPLQVKQAVTTYGKADKRQVQEMVRVILCLPQKPSPDDAADALAVAICAANSAVQWESIALQ